MSTPFNHSYIYLGNVIHRRFFPKKHQFNYSLYMLALDVTDVTDVDKVENGGKSQGVFGFSWYHPLRFVEKDYLRGEPFSLSLRIKNKISKLNGYSDISKILMLVQVRCFGIYFSPANFYFCYDQNNNCTQMLAEVSNTPWNERHYYLVDLLKDKSQQVSKKVFQVSPFMDLNMSYAWQVKPPSCDDDKLLVKIANQQFDEACGANKTLFDASLILRKQPFNKRNLLKIWLQLPIMTLKVVAGIYWQALRLFIKKIPFIGYQKAN